MWLDLRIDNFTQYDGEITVFYFYNNFTYGCVQKIDYFTSLPFIHKITMQKVIPLQHLEPTMQSIYEKEWCQKWFIFIQQILNRFPTNPNNIDNPIKFICTNPNFTIDLIKNTPHINYKYICQNPNLTFQFILDNINSFKTHGCWKSISQHPSITLTNIEENMDLPWNYYYVSKNPNLTMKFINKHKTRFEDCWHDLRLYAKCIITHYLTVSNISDEEAHELSGNPHFTLDLLLKIHSTNTFLNWYAISENKNFTMDMVTDYSNNETVLCCLLFKPNFDWKYSKLSINPNLSYDFILKNKKECDRWKDIMCKHPNLTIENIIELGWVSHAQSNPHFCVSRDIVKIPTISINWVTLSEHPNVTLDDIVENPNIPWNYYNMSKNPNITMDFINMNSQKGWDLYELCKNEFKTDKTKYVNDKMHLNSLLMLMDFCATRKANNDYEMVFSNDYLVKMILDFNK